MALPGTPGYRLPTFAGSVTSERERSPFAAGLKRASTEIQNNIPMAIEKAVGTLTPEREAMYQERLRKGLGEADAKLPGGPMGINQVDSLGDIRTLVKENIFYSLPQMGAALGGGVAGGLVGGPVGALAGATAVSTPFFVGSNISRATEEGTKPLTDDALTRSVAVAPVQAAADTLVGRFLPGAGKFLGPAASVQTGGFLARTAKSVGKAGVTEAVTETGQQAAERFAAGLVLTDRDAAAEYVNAFGTAFFTGGAMGSLGGFRTRSTLERADPSTVDTVSLSQDVDRLLGQQAPMLAAPQHASVPQGATVTVGPDGDDGAVISHSNSFKAPEQLDDTTRPFRNSTTEELQAGLNAAARQIKSGNASPEVAQFVDMADQELKLRSAVNGSETATPVNDNIAGAVQRELDVSGGAGQISAAPASATQPDWTTQLDGLLKGVSTRKNYIGASSREELETRLRDRLAAGSSAKGDFALAERLGIDTNAPAAPVEAAEPRVQAETGAAPAVANDQTDTPAPAAPANLEGGDTSVDAEFQQSWKEDVQKVGLRDPAVRALKPRNRADAERQIFEALGGRMASETTPDGKKRTWVQGESDRDGIEKLAQQYGLLDESGQLTQRADELALMTPIPTQEAVKAATRQGYRGAAASMFDRGAQAFVKDGERPNFATTEERDAFLAGVDWAAERNSVSRMASRTETDRKMATQFKGGQETAGQVDKKKISLSAEQRRQQVASQLVSRAEGVAPLTAQDDITTLKRMVRDGDIDGAMMGLQRVSRGERLFMDSARPEAAPFRGETVTRGAPRAGRVGSVSLVPTKGATKAEAEHAIRKHQLSRAIDNAFEAGTIDGKERLALVGKLRQGKFAEVMNAVPVSDLPATGRVSPRAASRAALRDQLRQIVDEVETEVPELDIDENGVLNDTNRYSRGERGRGAPVSEVIAKVEEITGQWKAKVEVHVAATISELPADVQESIRADNAEDAYGLVRDGVVYLIAGNLRDVDAATAVLYHEALGHIGLNRLFRSQLDTTLEQMYRSNAALKQQVDAWRAANPGAYGNNLARAVEEVFAQRSEQGLVEAGWLRKVGAVIKAFARRAGIKLAFSDGELQAILAMAHEQVTKAPTQRTSPQGVRYMLMSLWHGSPHDHDGFSTDFIGRGEGAQVYGWGLYFASVQDVAKQYRDALSPSRVTVEGKEPLAWVHSQPEHAILRAFDSELPGKVASQAQYMRNGRTDMWYDYYKEWREDRDLARREGDTSTVTTAQAVMDLIDRMESSVKRVPLGKLYEVNVKALDDQFMDWFAPLSEQSQQVRDALKTLGFNAPTQEEIDTRERLQARVKDVTKKMQAAHQKYSELLGANADQADIRAAHASWAAYREELDEAQSNAATTVGRDLAGADVYHAIARQLVDTSRDPAEGNGWQAATPTYRSDPKAASQALLAAGIRGNKYRDQFTRGKDDGTYNYVVFDASDIEIANKYSRPQALNERAQQVTAQLSKAANNVIGQRGVKSGLRKIMAGWMHMTHMVEQYGSIFPQQKLLLDAHADRRATQAVLAHLYREPSLQADKLQREQPNAWKMTNELMELTAWDIDYAKTWADNSHLHGLDNAQALKALWEAGYRKYNLLKKDGHHVVLDAFRQLNEVDHFASMALAIRQMAAMDPELKREIGAALDTDPMATFRNNSDLHDATEARKYWRDVLDAELKAVEDYSAKLSGMTISEKEAASRNARLKPIETYAKEVKKSIRHMEQAPYFHLGRFGRHFVSGSIRLGADKKVDQDAIDHVARELEKAGVTDARISRDLTQPTIFLRVESEDQRASLAEVFKQLQADGWLNKDVEVKDGPLDQLDSLPERTRDEVRTLITAIKADPMFEISDGMTDEQKLSTEKMRNAVERRIYDVWLDLLPDAATAKVLTHRESKPGFSKDMARSFAHRYNITVNSLSNLSATPYIDEAFEKMRGHLNEAKVTGSQFNPHVDTIQTLYDELKRRESERAVAESSSFHDRWRAWTHAYYLGMSPSYMLVNLTQMGVLLWPELAKKHGYTKSARAIGSVTKTAFDIMAATMKQGYATGGTKGAADVAITRDVIRSAVGDDSTADFLMNMIGSGMIDIGSSARELAQLAERGENSTQDTILTYAASAGLYSETFTRLVAALAAHKLHKGDGGIDYAKSVVRESMLEYSTWNNARNMGKMGVAGRFTPVMMSFLQYSTQVTEKLYRELYAAFSANASAEQKVAARKFLGGHLTAVTTLAGTLGMPFATVGALAIEKLADMLGDDEEPFDATAAWRNAMADLFGKEVGEVVSRGLPRAAGFDLSTRVGEQNLLPFSQWLADKREWKDASAEAALRSLGAPVSMVSSLATGMGKIADGDWMGGMTEMMPTAIKGPSKAYQMTTEGYVDTKGNTLPMTPGATAIMYQLMGLNPAEKAEYSEARGDQAARDVVLTRRAEVLRNKIARAVIARDDEAMRDAIREAQKFSRDNPRYDVLSDIEGSVARRMEAQAVSQATGTPIGTDPKDPAARRRTSYANIEFRAQ